MQPPRTIAESRTDNNNEEILNLLEEKLKGNNQDIQQENNALISGIYEVNNLFIEQRTIVIATWKNA